MLCVNTRLHIALQLHCWYNPSHLAVAVLDNHEHRRVLALHGSVQCLDAHAMLGRTESERPRVADRPRREILGELQ